MKTMTCRQLGGARDEEFHASTFGEMAEISKKHGMEMYERKDEEHIRVMREMMELMKDPDSMKEWIQTKQSEFDSLPEDG